MDSVFQRIKALLDAGGIVYQVIDHEPVYTSQQAADIRGTTIEQGAKAMVMKADRRPVLVVLASHLRVDTKRFKHLYGVHDLRLAGPDEVEELTGLKPGSIPPFGNAMELPTYVDRSLLNNDRIAFNAGLHTRSIVMACHDYITVVRPEIGKFAS